MSDDLSNGPHGTDRREHVIRPGMLYGLFLQGFAYSFVSDKFRMFPESEVLTAERKQKGPLQETVVKPPGLSSPCTMKGGEGLLTTFGVGFTPHI
jgi:hypothetical protein